MVLLRTNRTIRNTFSSDYGFCYSIDSRRIEGEETQGLPRRK